MELDREERLRQTREAWGAQAHWFRFLTAEEEETADRARDALLAELEGRVEPGFGGSKPHVGPLSPGCRRCGEGRWSCLFFTRECDAACGFCPAYNAPGEIVPYADGLTFPRVDDFLAWIERVGVDGVSFSGGEPLLRPDRLVDLVRETRAALGPDGWIWAYTNGQRATPPVLARLAAAGLDELRFNVAATGYRLAAPARAVGVVGTVTVEVPVVPDDEDRLRAALAEMAAIGVDHVNLHETMLYGMNAMHVGQRGYRLRNGTTPTLADAEPGALRLLRHVVDEGLDLAVQYCSHVFKGRWQARGSDARVSRLVVRPYESLTAWGSIRRVRATLDEPARDRFLEGLGAVAGHGPDAPWHVADDGTLILHPSLLRNVEPDRPGAPVRSLHVEYLRPRAADEAHADLEYRPVTLASGRTVAVLLCPLGAPIPLGAADAAALVAGGLPAADGPLGPYEHVGRGLGHGLGTGRGSG